MSEEEKEAKLELNRYIYGKNISKDDLADYLGILFNLIEKQQKEIEGGYHKGFIDGRISMKYEAQDKIIEKIKEVSNGTYDAKIILEKLLEEN